MTNFDLIIIGAGIQGAGLSYIASALGLRCLLLEKSAAVGSATSSNSSKLIHGGLRYLESGQFHLVRECLIERTRLLDAAPDIVKLKPFYIPIYKTSRRSNATIALGLSLYQCLGGKGFNFIAQKNRSQLPLKQSGLTGLWRYWDCQTDDLALTQRVVLAAQKFGCTLALNTQPLAIEINRENTAGAKFQLTLSNNTQVQTQCLINAAGPWVNQVAQLNASLPQAPIQWVQGSHLVIDRPALEGCFYLESPLDGRPFFVLPWQGRRLIGTTETPLTNPADAKITQAEIHYLITSYNHYFDSELITANAITRTYCGTRVLPSSAAAQRALNQTHNQTHNQTQRSINHTHRETQWVQNANIPGYLALYGGKLTSFYATALKGISLLMPHLIHNSNPNTISLGHSIIQHPKF